nr:drebrin-like protein isoform X2 [Halyomorpha halys]
MAVNLDKNKTAMISAWKEVVEDKSPTNWALFGYEGQTNDLNLISKGDGGIEELKDEFSSGQIMYAFLKVLDPKTSLPKCVLINWQGEGAPLVRKGTCANHIRDVSNLLRGAHITINARNEEEVDEDVVIEKVAKSTGSAYSFKERIGDNDRQTAPVGTTYQRVIPKNEINISERDKFWQKEEEEEKKRLAEEKRKQDELKAQAERERQEREAEKTTERDSPERFTRRNNSVRQEAEELIKMRDFDPRAVFEKNTSVGQLSSRKSSLQNAQNEVVTTKDSVHKLQNAWPPQAEKEVKTEPIVEDIPKLVSEKVEVKPDEVIKEETVQPETVQPQIVEDATPVEAQYVDDGYNGSEYIDFNDLGLRAEALYDYQAADETEISFDPGDIITHIDQIDTGWWQGLAPDGTFGLFPANYVQLLE